MKVADVEDLVLDMQYVHCTCQCLPCLLLNCCIIYWFCLVFYVWLTSWLF